MVMAEARGVALWGVTDLLRPGVVALGLRVGPLRRCPWPVALHLALGPPLLVASGGVAWPYCLHFSTHTLLLVVTRHDLDTSLH